MRHFLDVFFLPIAITIGCQSPDSHTHGHNDNDHGTSHIDNAEEHDHEGHDHDGHSHDEDSQGPVVLENAGIKLTEVENSQEYSNAKIKLVEPDVSQILSSPARFHFEVDNYDLGVQTSDAETKNCANSGKGQHIHFIMDNEPYSAHYETEFEKEIFKGQHFLLAFLSRSYHESVKSPGAYLFTSFSVDQEPVSGKVDMKSEHLFYSRPKGTYKGSDTEKLLLDFYLVNTTISPNGNKVKATINGTTFILTKWAPFMIEGLPLGENTVRIQLIGNDGSPIPGAFNDSGERVINLVKG